MLILDQYVSASGERLEEEPLEELDEELEDDEELLEELELDELELLEVEPPVEMLDEEELDELLDDELKEELDELLDEELEESLEEEIEELDEPLWLEELPLEDSEEEILLDVLPLIWELDEDSEESAFGELLDPFGVQEAKRKPIRGNRILILLCLFIYLPCSLFGRLLIIW